MSRLRRKIKIELMSDLCVGSGYSYAGVFDCDVAYDEYGLPQIPARRLKGCMREAADLLYPEISESLFGETGSDGVNGLILTNGYIEDYEAIAEELEGLRINAERKEARYLSPQNILKMYTGVRAQTRISKDTGAAEENTLRYTRVVGQYDPRKERVPLCFYAEAEFDEIYSEQMKRIVKAVRNIGMIRNRGLGSVRCVLTGSAQVSDQIRETGNSKGEGRVCLTYVLRNQEPLLLSSDNNEVSDPYISGKSILGALAGAYLRGEKVRAEGEEFRNLFLDGTTIFTNANLTFPVENEENGRIQWPDYYPAPLYLNRLKKTKALVNLLAENKEIFGERENDYDMAGGNLPKKLKTHYIHQEKPNEYEIAEPEREILYHNSRRELLYSQEAVKEGQYFQGKIYTDSKYSGLIKNLLENSRLSFGKSRTAQYGTCALAAQIDVKDVKDWKEEPVGAQGRERIAVVFRSDGIFVNDTGSYTVMFEEVKKIVANELEIPWSETEDTGSMVQTKEITGYNTVWNLRRPGVPAVKAGSVLVYTMPDGENWSRTLRQDQAFVGERNLEGCGQVQILSCKAMVYGPSCAEGSAKRTEVKVEKCRDFLMKILTKQLLERLIFLYTRQRPKLNLSAATVGRLDLMLRESLNRYKDDPEQAFCDFCERVI